MAPKSDRAARAGEGVALIEVDGVVRTVRVGAKVDGELRLLRVDARSASLGVDGQAPTQVLQMQSPTGARDRQSGTTAPSATVLAVRHRPVIHLLRHLGRQCGSAIRLSRSIERGQLRGVGVGAAGGGPHCSRAGR